VAGWFLGIGGCLGEAMNKEFYFGCAVILSSLARDHGFPNMAIDIMHCNGITFDQLKQAGCEEFDLAPLRKEWRDRNRNAKKAASNK
jgi:hypothetical protein